MATAQVHKSQKTTLSKLPISINIEFYEIKWQMLLKNNSSAPREADNCFICKRMDIAQAGSVISSSIKKKS